MLKKYRSRSTRNATLLGEDSDALIYERDVEPLLNEGGGMFGKFGKFLKETWLGRAAIAVLGVGAIGGLLSGCGISRSQANTVSVHNGSFWNGDMGADLQTGTSWDHDTVHITVGNDCRVSTHTGSGKTTSYDNIDTVEYQHGQRVGILHQDPGGFWGNPTNELKQGDYQLGAERTHTSWGESTFHTASGVEVKVSPVTNGEYQVTMYPHGDTDPTPVSKLCTPDFGIGL